MNPPDETKLEVLNDHYKDTFSWLQESRKSRDRYFALVVLFAALLLLQLAAPDLAGEFTEQLVSSRAGVQTKIDVSIVESVVWFVLLGLTIRYYQTTASLERQYQYIHMLEETLCQFFGGRAFTREGKFYLAKFPAFSEWVSILYMWVWPSLLIAIVVAKLAVEIVSKPLSLYLVFNVFVGLAIFAFTVLYLRMIHTGK